MDKKKRRLIDNGAPTIFAYDITSAEIVGSTVRATLVEHFSLDGEPIANVVCNLIWPLDANVPTILCQLLNVQLRRKPDDDNIVLPMH